MPEAPPRRQLTLFVPAPICEALERVRVQLDPIQHGLIGAHVTLCRDQETAGLKMRDVRARLAAACFGPLHLTFGPAEGFDGHGLRLACIDGQGDFDRLREAIWGAAPTRRELAHITLAHPRNPKAPGADIAFTQAQLPARLTIAFAEIAWITQAPGAAWAVRARMPL